MPIWSIQCKYRNCFWDFQKKVA